MTNSLALWRRNIHLMRWHQALRNLLFWQATWFLYLQETLSAAEAILLYAIYDMAVTILEVPSGYMSDRIGRRITLLLSAISFSLGLICLTFGGSFFVFAAGQVMLGVGIALNSGTDSSLLYQSLAAQNRAQDMEKETLIAWRISFSALAISAALGGFLALWSLRLPFAMSALASLGLIAIALLFQDPPPRDPAPTNEKERLRSLASQMKTPVVAWLFVFGVVMYGFNHIPFVFGQPLIAQVLGSMGFSAEAPVVSGLVTAVMMGLSLLASIFAPHARAHMGLISLLLLAFAFQVIITWALAILGSAAVIILLLLRMVPEALSTPFILATLQQHLDDTTRATLLSLKSFFGRLLFAGSLWIAAAQTSTVADMPLSDLQNILWGYATLGCAVCAGLGIWAIWVNAKT